MLVIFGITIIGFIVLISKYVELNIGGDVTVVKFLDMVTISIPPALTVAMNISITFSITALREK